MLKSSLFYMEKMMKVQEKLHLMENLKGFFMEKLLMLSAVNFKFFRNRVDVCKIKSPIMLSPLEKIEIGHDDSGVGPAWYLDKVVVTCSEIGCEQVSRISTIY